MHKYHDKIQRLLFHQEKVEKVFEQSDAYIYENPLRYLTNWLYLSSFCLNVLMVWLMVLAEYPRFEPVKASQVGGLFYILNLALFGFTMTRSGNLLRGIKLGNFKYQYDYAHKNDLDDDSADNRIHLRSIYSWHFIFMTCVCGMAMHSYVISGTPIPGAKQITVFVIGLLAMPAMFIHMHWRQSHRKICIVTNLRVILYDLATDEEDYIYLGRWVQIKQATDYYTISLKDTDLARKMFFLEALIDYLSVGVDKNHSILIIRGMKNFEQLRYLIYKKKKARGIN
jgi:hypothetical protein